jgi:hypothetical protein
MMNWKGSGRKRRVPEVTQKNSDTVPDTKTSPVVTAKKKRVINLLAE